MIKGMEKRRRKKLVSFVRDDSCRSNLVFMLLSGSPVKKEKKKAEKEKKRT